MAINGRDGADYLLTQIGKPYREQDCIEAVVVNPIRRLPGGKKDYKIGGCTALWKSAEASEKYRDITERLTLAEAKKQGLKIGDLPVIYDSDLERCEHIAYYMGGVGGYECIHSSATKECVCGTTLKNGFTHVLRHRYITGVEAGAGDNDNNGNEIEVGKMNKLYSVKVTTETSGLNLRPAPSTRGDAIDVIPRGETIPVYQESGKWLLVEYNGQTGYVSKQYTTRVADDEKSETSSDASWGVFIRCGSQEDALALASKLGNCAVCQHEIID